jgi:cytochrome c peroxidase
MKTLAQGKNGMSVPSLFGLSVGAPFFHAGNARTLEELFDPTFAAHYQALAPDFLGQNETFTRSDRIAQLIAFLLSIDENTTPPDLLDEAADGSALNYDLCRP